MTEPLRLMCIFAHPDDESLGTGPTLAKYAAEGVETYLITATRGERGWSGYPEINPELGKTREAELQAAAKTLSLREVCLLDYIDGDLDQADPAEVTAKIAHHLRRIRPQVVITFPPDGAYGHTDHIAISQFTMSAILRAADSNFTDPNPPFNVSKLYFMALTQRLADLYQRAFGDITMTFDGVERSAVIWPDWSISAQFDTTKHWRTAWQAVSCHHTQLPNYDNLIKLSDEYQEQLWGTASFYRAFSLVNGGRAVEDDLFAGLR